MELCAQWQNDGAGGDFRDNLNRNEAIELTKGHTVPNEEPSNEYAIDRILLLFGQQQWQPTTT